MIEPAPYFFLVAPSLVDDQEEERPSGIHVVRLTPDVDSYKPKIRRGIIQKQGSRITEMSGFDDIGIGCVLFYLESGAYPFGELHLVEFSWEGIVGWER